MTVRAQSIEETEALQTPSILRSLVNDAFRKETNGRTISSSDSSFGSSFFSSSFGASAAAPPPEAAGAGAPPPTAGAPPPEPTFERRSFTSLPSSAFARRFAQIGSSSMLAAKVKARILSGYHCARGT
jgi:hypothetical protein